MDETVNSTADPQGPHKARYEMMSLLVDTDPLPRAQLEAILAAHAAFIAAGGGGGRWETFVTSGGFELGVVLGVYVRTGEKVTEGSQADLTHKRLEGLDLTGVELPYANCCGAWCQNQDMSGANLQGSLWVDSDLSGSVLRGANLSGADISRSQLVGCDLRDANLTGADLENADLRNADLSGALLDGARLAGAYIKLPGVDWS